MLQAPSAVKCNTFLFNQNLYLYLFLYQNTSQTSSTGSSTLIKLSLSSSNHLHHNRFKILMTMDQKLKKILINKNNRSHPQQPTSFISTRVFLLKMTILNLGSSYFIIFYQNQVLKLQNHLYQSLITILHLNHLLFNILVRF